MQVVAAYVAEHHPEYETLLPKIHSRTVERLDHGQVPGMGSSSRLAIAGKQIKHQGWIRFYV